MPYKIKNFDVALSPLDIEDEKWLAENYPELEIDYEIECPTCGKNKGDYNNGSIIVNNIEYECYCRNQVGMQRHFLAANIGAKFHRLGIKNWKGDEHAISIVSDYVNNLKTHALNGEGVYIFGNTGVGKSMLAAIIAKECVKKGYGTYFITTDGYASLVRAGWHDESIRRYITRKTEVSKVLILDDFGAEQSVDKVQKFADSHAKKIVEDLIRNRVQSNKITIFTSNISPSMVKTMYGQRIYSLLFEATKFLEVGGDDYRMKEDIVSSEGFII